MRVKAIISLLLKLALISLVICLAMLVTCITLATPLPKTMFYAFFSVAVVNTVMYITIEFVISLKVMYNKRFYN